MFANKVQDWVTAGCTRTEANGFSTSEDYQAFVNETYGTAAAEGLGGDYAMQQTNGEITTSDLYQQITELKNQVTAKYMEMIHSGDTVNLDVSVENLSERITGQNAGEYIFIMDIELEFTAADIDPQKATLNLELHVAGENYEIILVDGSFSPVS